MKLYTEKEVRNAIQLSDKYHYILDSEENEIINALTPIELPSDEEIFSESLNHKEPDDFNCGSQFVIDYINQQDK